MVIGQDLVWSDMDAYQHINVIPAQAGTSSSYALSSVNMVEIFMRSRPAPG